MSLMELPPTVAAFCLLPVIPKWGGSEVLGAERALLY